MSRKYTDEELKFLRSLRTQGMDWLSIPAAFEEKFGRLIPRTSLNNAYLRATRTGRLTSEAKVGRSHLVIADTQVSPDVQLDHLWALNRLIKERRPDVIIHLGDHWDFPSLSTHDGKGTKKVEGRRVRADIDAGNIAMGIILRDLPYKPELHFLFGNHETRLERYVDSNPELDGFLDYRELALDGWIQHPFLTIAKIDGIHYSHYFANPMSGRPWGGMISTMLKNVGYSFTMGHRQEFSYTRRDLTNGQVVHGMVAGAFYMHDEEYKGPQGNHHWRGVVMKHDVRDGEYDLEIISIDRVLKLYGG